MSLTQIPDPGEHPAATLAEAEALRPDFARLRERVERHILGQPGLVERLLIALLGFNVGVEAGQLLALAALAALALVAARLPGAFRQRSLDYASVGLFALGVFWFVERSLTLG